MKNIKLIFILQLQLGFLSSGMQQRITFTVGSRVSEENKAAIFTVEKGILVDLEGMSYSIVTTGSFCTCIATTWFADKNI